MNWTIANLACRCPTPGGGFLGLDSSVSPSVNRFYDAAGVATGITIPDGIGEAYVTRRGITYAEVGFDKVRAYDQAGTQILERMPTDIILDPGSTWNITNLMVDDCNVPNGGSGQATIFCAGRLTNPVSGLNPFPNWSFTHFGAAITSPRDNASGNWMRINGHWATHT